MTKIEQEFFKTFGIEKQPPCKNCGLKNTSWDCKNRCLSEKMYPKITDRVFLELIFIINSYDISNFSTECMNKEDLKNDILEQVLFLKSNKYLGSEYEIELINKIKSLFREEGE